MPNLALKPPSLREVPQCAHWGGRSLHNVMTTPRRPKVADAPNDVWTR